MRPSFLRPWLALAVLVATVLGASGCAPLPTTSGALVDYRRSGGFAGLDDHLVITPDGAVTLTVRTQQRQFQLSPDQLARLQQLLRDAGFPALQSRYTPARGGADQIQYTIVYGGRRVETVDTAAPPALQPLIQALNALIAGSSAF